MTLIGGDGEPPPCILAVRPRPFHGADELAVSVDEFKTLYQFVSPLAVPQCSTVQALTLGVRTFFPESHTNPGTPQTTTLPASGPPATSRRRPAALSFGREGVRSGGLLTYYPDAARLEIVSGGPPPANRSSRFVVEE